MRTGVSLFFALLVTSPASAQLAEICDNARDDDGDAGVDCADPDCAGHSACPPSTRLPPENTPRLCQNELDDDGDGAVDCDDTGCAQLIFCVRRPDVESEPPEDELAAPDDGAPGTRGIYAPREPEEPEPAMGFVEHDDPREYPQPFARHPMTYLRGMLVPTLGLSVRQIGDFFGARDHLTQLGVGLSYGIFDIWQVTVLAPPFALSPSFDVENPAVSTTLRILRFDFFELGVYANVAIPIGTSELPGPAEPLPHHHLLARSRYSNVAQLDLALMARLHAGEWVRFDLTLPMSTLVFGEDATGAIDVRADLVLDLRVSVQITELAYAGVFSGVIARGPGYDRPHVPFGFFAGATIPGHDRGPAADVGVRFGWPFFYLNEPGIEEVDADFWQLTVEARVYSYLLP